MFFILLLSMHLQWEYFLEIESIITLSKEINSWFIVLHCLLRSGQLDSIKEKIRRHPFFWDYDKRKFLLISEVPLAMISASFRSKIQECKDLCIVPWGKDDYDGLIELMDGYRVDKSMPKFDKKSRVDYVLCISGMYAHEKELKVLCFVNYLLLHVWSK